MLCLPSGHTNTVRGQGVPHRADAGGGGVPPHHLCADNSSDFTPHPRRVGIMRALWGLSYRSIRDPPPRGAAGGTVEEKIYRKQVFKARSLDAQQPLSCMLYAPFFSRLSPPHPSTHHPTTPPHRASVPIYPQGGLSRAGTEEADPVRYFSHTELKDLFRVDEGAFDRSETQVRVPACSHSCSISLCFTSVFRLYRPFIWFLLQEHLSSRHGGSGGGSAGGSGSSPELSESLRKELRSLRSSALVAGVSKHDQLFASR